VTDAHPHMGASAAVLEALLEAAAAVLAADSLDDTLRRMAIQLRALVPYDDLAVYELVDAEQTLSPAFAAGRWADEVMAESSMSIGSASRRGFPRPRRRLSSGSR